MRKWLYGIAVAMVLSPAMVTAQQTADCLQDEPGGAPHSWGSEPGITVPEPGMTVPGPGMAAGGGTGESLAFSRRLNEAGDAALARGDLATAEKYHRRALAIREKLVPRSLPVAETWNALGNVALERGELAKAQKYFEHSLSLRRMLAPGSREVALSLNSLGVLARRRGDVAGEEGFFQQALELRDVLQPADLADIFDGLGSACTQRNCAQKPEDYLRRALLLRQQSQPESLSVAGTLAFLGRSANNQGDLREAERDFTQALELRRRLAPGSMALAASLTDLGVLARTRGNLASAELCFRQALRIRQHWAPHSLGVADSLHNLGIVFWLRDDLQSAQDDFEQTLRLRRKLAPGSPALAQSLIWQGILSMRRDRLAAAESYFEQARELFEKTLSPRSMAVAAVLSNLGSVSRARGELALSQEYYRRALDIEAPDSPAAANSLQSLGGLMRQHGDLVAAEGYLRRALVIQEQKVPNSSAHAAAMFALASLLRQEKKREETQRLYAQALEILERQTESLGGTPEDRSVFRARYENSYKDYADLLVALGQAEPALRILERGRARGLLETLEGARVSLHGQHDNSLDRLQHTLEEEIGARSSYRIRLLNDSHTEAQLSEVDRQLSDLRARYRQLQEQSQLSNPAYAALTQPQTLTGREMQALLDDDTLLLEYSLRPGASHLWAVTRTTLAVYGLPARKTIEESVAQLRELLTARASRPKESEAQRDRRLKLADARYGAAARDLSRLVLGPVAALLQGRASTSAALRRIVIVPDGALQYIPFAALPAPSAPTADESDDPLVMHHEVVNLPSVAVLAELRRQALQRAAPPRAVVVLADPVFDSRDERIQRSDRPDVNSELPDVPAPQGSAAQRAAGGESTRMARLGAPYLGRLLWTRLEAAEILKVTPPGQGLQVLDFAASRATALSPFLSQYRIVHFATHAVSDGEHPERSGLVLSLFDRQGQPQNGFLGLEQIYGLNLPADLVVLSACDTGLGREVDGEGLIGLVRGFMYAGAIRVMASLWSVDDEVTAQLMAHFYQGLEQNALSPSAALRAAQMQIRKEARWSSPYYWAGFQIEGEWR